MLDARRDLENIDVVAGFIGYRHLFNAQWRSNVFYARADYDNPATGEPAQTASSQSLHLNLFYSPVAKWDIGTELMFAERELESGANGALIRLHASVKYSF